MAASWEHCHYFSIWTNIYNSQASPQGVPQPESLEEAAKGQDQLTFISCTLALRRTALSSPLSSPGFSYRLSHCLINCCLPVRWTAADFKEANATSLASRCCFPECFKSPFGLPYRRLITPSRIFLGILLLGLISGQSSYSQLQWAGSDDCEGTAQGLDDNILNS